MEACLPYKEEVVGSSPTFETSREAIRSAPTLNEARCFLKCTRKEIGDYHRILVITLVSALSWLKNIFVCIILCNPQSNSARHALHH